MNDPGKPGQHQRVSCEVCLAEIPRNEAKSLESQEYVLYFCGLGCYDQWVAEAEPRRGDAGDEG
ncbi:DUF3330 domain-containing protein [Thiohalorhabdus methylotrophus]|uniref:DUF3330 domain-containing protein n=1 Tax=Thiohalorhabdus methylotrophus TaxID=3242694 RepID=A0ABV4TXF0_9GAMM